MSRLRTILIAFDQFIGSLLFRGIGADETISAYCWRRDYRIRIWLLDLAFGKNHCRESYMSEKLGLHLDREYKR